MVDGLNNLILPGQIQSTATGSTQSLTNATQTTTADGKDFKQTLLDNLDQVNKLQQEAQQATEKLATGQTDNVAEVFSAVRKADVAFSLLMQIRNQLVDAYTEIRNMQI
jgi:flagellar hook-basal body complex protein FliE